MRTKVQCVVFQYSDILFANPYTKYRDSSNGNPNVICIVIIKLFLIHLFSIDQLFSLGLFLESNATMAALMNKAGMQGVISTDDLKELLECPV